MERLTQLLTRFLARILLSLEVLVACLEVIDRGLLSKAACPGEVSSMIVLAT